MGSSAAGAVRFYPQLVLCSYNTFFSQSMHTLSLKNVGCRSFITVDTVARQKAKTLTFHTIFHQYSWKVKHLSSDDSYILGSRLKCAG
jgi:hypothetical protein